MKFGMFNVTKKKKNPHKIEKKNIYTHIEKRKKEKKKKKKPH